MVSSGGGVAKIERVVGVIGHHEEDGITEEAKKADSIVKPSSPNNDQVDSINYAKEEHEVLESAKAEMGHVKEENERLKALLGRIENDYKSLQQRLFDKIQLESCKRPLTTHERNNPRQDETEQLVSLSLGMSSSSSTISATALDHSDKMPSKNRSSKGNEEFKNALSLGLLFESKKVGIDQMVSTELVSSVNSTGNSSEQVKDDEANTQPSMPDVKRHTDGNNAEDNNDISQVKRARVCVRARCDTPVMNDGCQWRKYGQKIAKGNPCPRAYYRCTVAAGCPVRKQVQRCASDMSILITTYEGKHNHPLPVSATAMASTTSAAASMLLAGSSTSQTGLTGSHAALYGDNLSASKQYYFSNSASPLFPTITLDLTTTPSTSSSPFNMFSSRLPPTSLSFSSNEPKNITFPSILSNGFRSNYTSAASAIVSTTTTSSLLGNQNLEKAYQGVASQQALTETLTKALTSDPSFRTVVASAISSMINNGNGSAAIQVVSEADSLNGKACSSSYFNGLASSSSQTGSFVQSSLAFNVFNSSSMATTNSNKEHGS